MDGLDNQVIKDLASLASWGAHKSNVERDLHTMIPTLFGSEFPTYDVEIEAYDPDMAAVKPVVIPVLLASDVLCELWKKQSPKLWDVVIGCNASSAKTFWTSYRSNGAFTQRHPVIQPISSIG